MNKLLLIIGAVAYILLLLVQCLAYWDNVEFSFMVTLAILLQAVLAVPVLLHGLSIVALPIERYVIALFALIGVLAISGQLGLPRYADASIQQTRINNEMTDYVNETVGEEEYLEAVLLAAEEEEKLEDFDKKKTEALKDKDELKDEDRQKQRIYEAELALAKHERLESSEDLYDSQPLNGLIILAGFLMLAGGMTNVAGMLESTMKKRSTATPAATPPPPTTTPPSAPADTPTATPHDDQTVIS